MSGLLFRFDRYQEDTTRKVLDTILSIQPKEARGGEGETREALIYRLATELLEKLPSDYIAHEVKERLAKLEPMNIFLRQEIDRFQRVLYAVRHTLLNLKLAIDGTIVMNEELRDALDRMYDAKIPHVWLKLSWESSTLGAWFTDLYARNEQYRSWLKLDKDTRPIAFWMTGFFNPQGFLTAMRQVEETQSLVRKDVPPFISVGNHSSTSRLVTGQCRADQQGHTSRS